MTIPTSLVGVLTAAAICTGCGVVAEGESGEPNPGPQVAAWKQPADKPRGPQPAQESGRAHSFDLTTVARGLDFPVQVVARPGDRRMYVVELPGRVRRIEGDGRSRTTFLDLRKRTRAAGERGLLSVAFSPAGDEIVALYTTRAGHTRVVAFPAAADSAALDNGRTLLAIEQPYENHKGGTVLFDERGRLLVSLGDGGSAFDPGNRAQNPDEPLGSILRRDEGRWDVVAYGLRNPWRMAFDDDTGMLWIGDVGQDRLEEIDAVYVPETGQPSLNLGWAAYEGHLPLGRKPVAAGRLTWPVAVYPHRDGHCSVAGGAVYRGAAIKALRGRYVYGDFCRGTIWSLDSAAAQDARRIDVRRELARLPGLVSFGTGFDGEIYATSTQGTISKLVSPKVRHP